MILKSVARIFLNRDIMSPALRKFLFLIVMFKGAASVMAQNSNNPAEMFGQSISSAFSKYYTTEVILSLMASLVLLVIVLIIYETHRVNKTKRELRALAMAKFDLQAERSDINSDNVAILREIIEKTGLHDPGSIIKFSRVFEDSIEKYYESEKIELISDERLERISALRKELGFSPLPGGVAITSTRQFCSGNECTIQIHEQTLENVLPGNKEICRVIDSGERQWSVTRPDWPPVQVGTWMHMSLTRLGDAEYTFKTQVLKDSDRWLVLRHTSKLDRVQHRNWLRVEVDIPVKVFVMEEDNVIKALSGEIIDVSGGGLGMALPAKLPNGSMLLLNFTLPGRDQINGLLVKVVRVAGLYSGDPAKTVHSVAFSGETSSVNEKIIQYVFEKQRKNISIY